MIVAEMNVFQFEIYLSDPDVCPLQFADLIRYLCKRAIGSRITSWDAIVCQSSMREKCGS